MLQTILRVCHRVVVSEDLRKEYRRNASSFAETWLTSMYARKKVIAREPSRHGAIVQAIERATLTDKEREAAAKDLHLVLQATQTDHLVVSADERARRAFARVRSLHALGWARVREDDVLKWLEDGADVDAVRLRPR